MSRTYSVSPTVHGRRTFCALMVMPRSRSMSIRSRYWARICRASMIPVTSSIRSASVDLPWSMWAMMQKFRMRAGSVEAGVVTVPPWSHATRAGEAVAREGALAGSPVTTPAGSPRPPDPDLPAPLRADIEAALGSPVATVTGCTGGFSPGTAAVLTCSDGTRAFVKAVGTPLNPDTPDLHRTEARVAAALPPALPAPRLRWWTERDVGGDVWVALLFDAVDGEPPALPWTPAAAARIVPVLTDLARAGTPCPVPGLMTVPDRLAAAGRGSGRGRRG